MKINNRDYKESDLINIITREILGDVWTLARTKDDKYLVGGTIFNTGFCPLHDIDFDDCFSVDENFQELVEYIELNEREK